MDWYYAKLKVIRLGLKIAQRLPLRRPVKQVYLRDRIKQYKQAWSQIAQRVDAQFSELDRDMWVLEKDNVQLRVRLHELPLDNNIVLKLCGRKPLVHKLLSSNGIPVPDHQLYQLSDISPAKKFLSLHPGGCVVKPCDGYAGLGVTTHVKSVAALEKASVRASLYLDDFMIEEQIVGENYRLLIYKGKLLHAVKRTGKSVVGDGVSSIRELIVAADNGDLFDDDLSFTLQAQQLGFDDVPGKDQVLLVRSIGDGFNGGVELRTSYDTVVTDMVHESVRRDAEQCAEIAQAALVGVDIITKDITKDLREVGGVVNEINTTPALHHHYDEGNESFPYPALIMVKDFFNID